MIGIELNHTLDLCNNKMKQLEEKFNLLRELEKEMKHKGCWTELVNWETLEEQELLILFHNRVSEKLNGNIEDKRLTVPHYHLSMPE